GFILYFDVKTPGTSMRLERQPLHFGYAEAFGPLPGAYQTLLQDVLEGDQTLFVHAGEVEASWRLYTPLLGDGPPLQSYAAGTWGPAAASGLIGKGVQPWRNPCPPRSRCWSRSMQRATRPRASFCSRCGSRCSAPDAAPWRSRAAERRGGSTSCSHRT